MAQGGQGTAGECLCVMHVTLHVCMCLMWVQQGLASVSYAHAKEPSLASSIPSLPDLNQIYAMSRQGQARKWMPCSRDSSTNVASTSEILWVALRDVQAETGAYATVPALGATTYI